MKIKKIRHKVSKAQGHKEEIKNSVPVCLSASVPNKRGFTLMELMVVIAIIVLLAGIMTPNVARRLERAKMIRAESDIAGIENAIAMYENDTGRYPPTGIGNLRDWLTGTLPADVNAPAAKNWHGPYIKGIDKDSWGNDYVYFKNEHPRDPCPPVNVGDVCNQVAGLDYPLNGDGSWVAPATNLSYYIYSTGKDKKTSNTPAIGDANPYEATLTANHDHNDDVNNWDVKKSWREEY